MTTTEALVVAVFLGVPALVGVHAFRMVLQDAKEAMERRQEMTTKPIRRNFETRISWHWNANGRFSSNATIRWSLAGRDVGATITHWGSALKIGPPQSSSQHQLYIWRS